MLARPEKLFSKVILAFQESRRRRLAWRLGRRKKMLETVSAMTKITQHKITKDPVEVGESFRGYSLSAGAARVSSGSMNTEVSLPPGKIKA